jgi:beta-galactosidase
MAWGGINEKNGEGILTRDFISGGWTWTGWDYRGEPTPYAWPNVNSHFGIMDLTGFWKDRTHWSVQPHWWHCMLCQIVTLP